MVSDRSIVSVNCFLTRDTHWEENEASELSAGTIDVWKTEVIADAILIDNFCTLLNSKELDRLNRYHHENDRQRFVTSRAFLKILLGKYLHQKPENILFSNGFNNKPFVQTNGKDYLKYNVSHSGSQVLIGISEKEIGVDIEKINSTFFFDEILNSAFNDKEIEFVKESEQPIASFYLLWTRKEALTKATSKGLDGDLKSIPSLNGIHKIGADIIGSDSSWNVSSFEIEKGYQASVAFDSKIKGIRFFTMAVTN